VRRKRRFRTASVDESGQDSFLDIIANIVGILIILVVVVGLRAKDVMVEAATTNEYHSAAKEKDRQLDEAQHDFHTMVSHIGELRGQVANVQRELFVRAVEQSQVQEMVVALQYHLDEKSKTLSEEARQRVQLESSLGGAQAELERLEKLRLGVELAVEAPIVLRHRPTPLAKTVFGKEEHFRLLGGRLTYVPMTKLVEKLHVEWQGKAAKLKNSAAITEIIGPVQGFRMKYTIERKEIVTQTQVGPIKRSMAKFTGFTLVPTSSNLGEPLEAALQAGSQAQRALSTMDPKLTTITVWTYPDSFADFRRLKEALHQQGFSAAARPMPEGMPIGGSPDGTRSAAQ